MHCLRCGSDNIDASESCHSCGASLAILCSACGYINCQGTRVCGQCATLLPSSGEAAETVLQALTSSGGERKHLTLLFADIRNSTILIDNLDPEAGLRRLQPALDCMRAAVERYGGVVNRTQGDGIMALFGAPRPHEDHAVRACMAALFMQDATARLRDPDLAIRVGVHSGEVVIQTLNNTLYQTLDAAGANVHLASRLEQMAEHGRILLTGGTFAAAKEFVTCRPLGPQPIRGLAAPVDVFELTGVRHAPASELFRGRPRLSPLSGRADIVTALESELANAIAGNGRVLGIAGEAGIGKSRLSFEFAENCRKKGIRVYEARVLAHGRATPLQPVLELLRAYCGVKAGETGAAARQQVVSTLQLLPAGEEAVLITLDLLGLADPARPSPRLDPVVRKTRLIELIRSIASAGRRDHATVILIEDLHWIDAASNELVETLIEAVANTTTLLLLNFRPSLTASWMEQPHYRQFNLVPLEQEETERLLDSLLGTDPSIALVRQNIVERSRGNPFFIEELVNSLAERGDLDGQHGAYRSARPSDHTPLPATIEAVLTARVDRLPAPIRRVLQGASVIGREFPIAILERVSEAEPNGLAGALAQLRSAGLVDELPPHTPGRYAFRHPLTQEVVYRSLLHERRCKLHGTTAHAIEEQYKDRPGEWAGLLAYHLEQAGELLKAAQASMRAAIWVGATDAREAFRSWKKVLALVAGEAPSPLTANLRMMACGQVMNFGWREGMTAEEAETYFEEARSLALAAGNMRANALMHAAYGRILAASGSADKYVAKVQEAASLIRDSNDASLQVTLKAVLCQAFRLAGRMQDALQANIEATRDASKVDKLDRKMLGFDIELWLTVMHGQILVTLGRLDEARPYLDRLLQLDPMRGDLTHHLASVAYVELAWAEGDANLAAHHANRAFAIALKSGSPYVRVYAQASRGLSHIVAGEPAAAVEDLAEALAFARRCKAGLEMEARILADLANGHRLRGDLDSAQRAAAEAIEIARARCTRVPECLAHLAYAEALLAADDDFGRAGHELQQARALLEATGAAIYRPLIDRLESRLPQPPARPRAEPTALGAS